MSIAERWLLPDGIDEILPPEAARIEALRRELLDEYHRWGYDLLVPPVAEYLESLLTGVGHDLDLLTFKITDQQTGRMMGLSADRTQQVARMDAHSIERQGVSRYCYCGSVLHTKKTHLLSSRSPIQIGAELYGYAGVDSEIEIVSLMMRTLEKAGLQELTLDLGHVGLYQALVEATELSATQRDELYSLVRLRALPELDAWLAQSGLPTEQQAWFRDLPSMAGSVAALEGWLASLQSVSPAVGEALANLKSVAEELEALYPNIRVHLDLAELRDYNYHTGLVFSAFVPGFGQPVARGGRYDDTGKVFGRARPATGFSCDLKVLANVTKAEWVAPKGIRAPVSTDATLRRKVAELRAAGERVVPVFEGQEFLDELSCDRELVCRDGEWQIQSITLNEQN